MANSRGGALMGGYENQQSFYAEVLELAKSRLVDANMLARVMLEVENAGAYTHYINRSMECEAVIAFAFQKLNPRESECVKD